MDELSNVSTKQLQMSTNNHWYT